MEVGPDFLSTLICVSLSDGVRSRHLLDKWCTALDMDTELEMDSGELFL